MAEQRTDTQNLTETEFVVAPQTRILVADLDKSLFGEGRWGDRMVNASVEILNQLLAYAENVKATTIIPTLLTARPASVFLGDDSPLRSYVGHSPDPGVNNQNQGIRGLHIVGCELGAVMLTRTDETDWQVRIDPQFQAYVDGPRFLISEFLQQEFVDTGAYKFEKGRLVGLSLQKNEGDLTEEEKIRIKTSIEKKLMETGNEELLQESEIDITGSDVDIFPKSLAQNGKSVGLYNIMRQLQQKDYPDADVSQVIMLDDSHAPVAQAFPEVKNAGGEIIAPRNAKPKLKELMIEHNGFIADHDEFLGALQGIWRAAFNEDLTFPWVKND